MDGDEHVVCRWTQALKAVLMELVEEPAEVAIAVTESPNRALPIEFLIRVHSDDVGRVVGRKGQTLHALRVLMNSWRGLHRRGAYLKVEGHIELADEAGRVLSLDRSGR